MQRYTSCSAVWGMSHKLNPTGPAEHLPTDAMGSPINCSDPKTASYRGNPTLRCLPMSQSLGEWYLTPLQVEEMKPLTRSVLDTSTSLVTSCPHHHAEMGTLAAHQMRHARNCCQSPCCCPAHPLPYIRPSWTRQCWATPLLCRGGDLCTCTLDSGNNFFMSSQTFFWNTDSGVKSYLKPLACAWASWSRSVLPAEKRWCQHKWLRTLAEPKKLSTTTKPVLLITRNCVYL